MLSSSVEKTFKSWNSRWSPLDRAILMRNSYNGHLSIFMHNGWMFESKYYRRSTSPMTHFCTCTPNDPCTGRIIQPKHWSSDANKSHFDKLMNHIDNSLMGIFSKKRSWHTKDRLLLGAFGHFISEKMDFLEKQQTIGHTIHKWLNAKHKSKSRMSEEDSHAIWRYEKWILQCIFIGKRNKF